MPLDKQIRYGIYTLLGAGALGLLCELILAANHNSIDGVDLTGYAVGLGIGWWLYLLSALAIVVGAIMALRNPQTLAGNVWQSSVSQYPYNQSYPSQSTQYPPYPPYPPQYPVEADPEQYQPTEMGQPYGPTERRPMPQPQTGPQHYPNTGPYTQPPPQTYPPSGELPPPPPPHSSQQLPPM